MRRSTGHFLLICLCLSLISGIGLAFFYDASPDRAHASIVNIESTFGLTSALRGLHFFSAHCSIIVALLHFIGSLLSFSVPSGRSSAWTWGFVSLLLVLTASFTGRILPWDEHGALSLHMATAFLGLDGVSLTTVLVLHVLSSGVIVIALALHARLHRRLSQKDLGTGGALDRVALAVTASGVLGLLVVSAAFRAPLGAPWDGAEAVSRASSEWYLRFFQALSLESLNLARSVALGFIVFGFLTPALYSRGWWRTVRTLWLVSFIVIAATTWLSNG